MTYIYILYLLIVCYYLLGYQISIPSLAGFDVDAVGNDDDDDDDGDGGSEDGEHNIDLNCCSVISRERFHLQVTQSGRLHGIAVWYDIQLEAEKRAGDESNNQDINDIMYNCYPNHKANQTHISMDLNKGTSDISSYNTANCITTGPARITLTGEDSFFPSDESFAAMSDPPPTHWRQAIYLCNASHDHDRDVVSGDTVVVEVIVDGIMGVYCRVFN